MTVTLTPTHQKYTVSVDEFRTFREQGFLVLKGLLSEEEVLELRQHTEDLMQGKLPEQTGQAANWTPGMETGTTEQTLAAPPEHLSPEEKAAFFLRIHMLHRKLSLHERYLLHPRVLDVLEALIGPDVLALQSMLFIKGPGKPGQGWHQDSYYIPTEPDTLCGAWIAIDDVDEYNGAMWFAKGSQQEPIYPPVSGQYGFGQHNLQGTVEVAGVSNPNDEENDLSRIADRYDQLLVSAKAGDVVFFGGHVLHRSKKNMTLDRFRRSFVGHYCNARSFTQWGEDETVGLKDPTTGMTNSSHILARGDTHLPFAKPRFGTPCAALLSPEERKSASGTSTRMMGDMDGGMMGEMPIDPNLRDDD
ncbi:phytanoyl-CoA dioxygenase family protein [Deinococcus cellulosilyticus]|uniref:Phytanoyl-CoA dioxygenase n=1 Tax=Deinococcus cellulosilyticus (strain DSM 18568 / NBRC 106333 / KACC 11606 / 5516J-15) TaxID=1223518 RepID=A0A511N0I4_DEIC1|nr:phytanoyl-CoA dioxygenase family protein [Deinococcus cellulosilyticus]GEM46319.1 hypothetical protein DC3_19540 [Deinococcus cellulosilyticus NBRC 106333 = KACC 11606]